MAVTAISRFVNPGCESSGESLRGDKKANELMAHTYSHLYGLPATGLRFFTVWPWGRPDMAPMLFAKAILAGSNLVFNHGRMARDLPISTTSSKGRCGCLPTSYGS